MPRAAEEELRRRTVDRCPYCAGPLTVTYGVTRIVAEVEVDEQLNVHAATYASLAQPGHHRTAWLECENNCRDFKEDGPDLAWFPDEYR